MFVTALANFLYVADRRDIDQALLLFSLISVVCAVWLTIKKNPHIKDTQWFEDLMTYIDTRQISRVHDPSFCFCVPG